MLVSWKSFGINIEELKASSVAYLLAGRSRAAKLSADGTSQFYPTDTVSFTLCARRRIIGLTKFLLRSKDSNLSAPPFIVFLATTPPILLAMGKLTSTIGIPIKLLNEAQVCLLSFINVTSSCLDLALNTGANARRYRDTSSPWKSPPESCIEENFSRVRRSTIVSGQNRLTRNSRG